MDLYRPSPEVVFEDRCAFHPGRRAWCKCDMFKTCVISSGIYSGVCGKAERYRWGSISKA